jgi:hypothetical protein
MGNFVDSNGLSILTNQQIMNLETVNKTFRNDNENSNSTEAKSLYNEALNTCKKQLQNKLLNDQYINHLAMK